MPGTPRQLAQAARLSRLQARRAGRFSYDAVSSKNRRRPPSGILRSEDQELLPLDRRKLVSFGRDLQRNYSLAKWMINKHLDYVANFTFKPRCKDKGLNADLKGLMKNWQRKENCDVAARHPFRRMVRLAEARRTVDGDLGLMKLADGRLQAIEGDRIRTPDGGVPGQVDLAIFFHGVQTDPAGKALAYAISKRVTQGIIAQTASFQFVFERVVPADNLYLFGYFDRFDQTRGVGPIAAALNVLQDTYEGCDYALAKMKIAQLFGLAIYREAAEQLAPTSSSDAGEDEGSDSDGSGYDINFGTGPVFLDLDPGDRAEFLESTSPSTEFQAFMLVAISLALKALDIPYSFYAENYTNYSGARQALLQYELSAGEKRKDVADLLDCLTEWLVGLWIDDGALSGVDPADVAWEWIPIGMPWIDPLNEAQANLAAIGGCLSTRTRVLREQGLDFEEIAEELAYEQQLLTDLKLPTTINPINSQVIKVGNG